MTARAAKATPRRRLFLASLLISVILMTCWITYFLLNFDLNNYRQQTEESLSSLLSLPVEIGGIHYNFHDTNLALHVDDLRIGAKGTTVQVHAPDVLINLKWRGLIERDLRFAKVSLLKPEVWVRPAVNAKIGGDTPPSKAPPLLIDQALVHKIGVDNLEILGGKVYLESSRTGQPTEQFEITDLDGELSNIRLNQNTRFTIKGDLKAPRQKGKSPWQLHGENLLELNEEKGLMPHVNLDLTIKALEIDKFILALGEKIADYSIEGQSDLSLHLEGSPSEALDFQAGLSSGKLALLPGAAYINPILFKNLLASGRVQLRGDRPGISNWSLQVDKSHLAGDITWAPSGQPFSATAAIVNSNLTIPQLKQWLPESEETLRSIRQQLLEQGAIHIEFAELTLFEDAGAQNKWQLDRLKGELLDVSLDLDQGPDAEIISLPFNVTDKLWQINNGQGRMGSLQLTINGKGEHNQTGISLTSLDFDSKIQPGKLFEEWSLPEHTLSIDGTVRVNGHLEGPIDHLNLDLQANLSQFSVSHPAGLTLVPGPDDKLSLHGTLSPHKIRLDHGAIKWSAAKGHLSGTYLTDQPDSLDIDALLTINDLTRLTETLPLLKKLKLHGQADLSISQKGQLKKNSPEMTLTLRGAGLKATRHIADLSHINGRVQVTTEGLTADKLQVHLGESPLTVQAQLNDFSNPQLSLDVIAPAVRAKDIIFNSDKAMIRNINGHLDINRDGLSFAPVDVRLDGGTDASVRGTISFHSPYDVQLDITSEFAQISEVIGLWSDRSGLTKERTPPPESKVTASPSHSQANITINAQVKLGDLYGMKFHDASGVITPTSKRLSIHPLDFSVGEGFCNAQVLTDFSAEASTRMLISGHAEDVDALEVYRELLNQENILRGKLRGDFYLSGELGPNYLPSSYGNFSIEVHDGVLHQFPVLSKVFSLLNVSQIFALSIPDMDLEGMPFDTLSANFNLEKGILRSEDLKIKSEAMNQAYSGQLDLIEQELDFTLAIHPLGTVDKVVSHIPIAGWLLTGEDRALLTAHFSIEGKLGEASVEVMPLDTLSEPTLGLLKRTLGLPFKLIEDPQILWGGDGNEE